MSRLLVATSWAPPEDECPLSASGSSVTSDPASSTGVQVQRSTGMLTRVTIPASRAVQRQVPAVSTMLATVQTSMGLSLLVNGAPVISETVSGTSSTAHTVHTPAAMVPVRSAR